MADKIEERGRLLAKRRLRFTIDVEVNVHNNPRKSSNAQHIFELSAQNKILHSLVNHETVGRKYLIDFAAHMVIEKLKNEWGYFDVDKDYNYLQQLNPDLNNELQNWLQNENFHAAMDQMLNNAITGHIINSTHTEISRTDNDDGTEVA